MGALSDLDLQLREINQVLQEQPMLPSRRIQFDQLITAFENGEVGEVEFAEVALDMGASLTAINDVLESVRAEDGVE